MIGQSNAPVLTPAFLNVWRASILFSVSIATAACPHVGFLQDSAETSSSSAEGRKAVDEDMTSFYKSTRSYFRNDVHPWLQAELKEQLLLTCDDTVTGVRIKVPVQEGSKLKVKNGDSIFTYVHVILSLFFLLHSQQNITAFVHLEKMDATSLARGY